MLPPEQVKLLTSNHRCHQLSSRGTSYLRNWHSFTVQYRACNLLAI